MITFTELRKRLGITQHTLTGLVREGLPHQADGKRKLFDEEQVAEWLIENDRAIVEGNGHDSGNGASRVARTRKGCADHFQVNVRTVSDWMDDETFPARAATPGQRNGYYPLDEIREWIQKRDATRPFGPQVDLRDDLLAIRVERERRRNLQEAGELAPIEDMVELVQRLTNVAKRLLESLPDESAKDLPVSLPEETRAAIKRKWQQRIEEIERVISEAIAGDADEADE